MALLKFSLPILLMLFSLLCAEEQTLDLTDTTANHGKSEWGAASLNLLLPGSGHLYLGENRRAILYLSTELVSWAGVLFGSSTSRSISESAHSYARIHAGTASTRDESDNYWTVLGSESYLNSGSFNAACEVARLYDQRYLADQDQWIWESGEAQTEYRTMRENSEKWRTASRLFIGGLLLNRIVSFVDGRVSARRVNSRNISITAGALEERKMFTNLTLLF